MTPDQDPPFAVQIEPVEGCNLACSMCGIQAIRQNGASPGVNGKSSMPLKHMSMDTATHLGREMARLRWNPRIEFAMHGEPTFNILLPDMVHAFRRLLPRSYIMVTSNGGGLLPRPDMARDLFHAGLNTLALDDYEHAKIIPKLRDRLPQSLEYVKDLKVYEYPDDPEGNPHARHRGRKLVYVKDIRQAQKGTHSHISNHACSSGPPNERYKNQRCSKPFRELAVRWDGNVALCCVDWPGHYKIGNIHDMPLDELWNHKRFQAARRTLMNEGRTFIPCLGCSEGVTRPGLLPDKFGKQALIAPTEATRRKLAEAIEGPPYTQRVKEVYE